MSKENVALFVRMIAEKRDLNKQASAEQSTQRWVDIARDAGLEFTADDLVDFVSDIIGKKVSAESAVREFIQATKDQELDDKTLDAVAGGIIFSTSLASTMTRAGYLAPGGSSASYTFPVEYSRSSSFDPSGGL